MKNAENRVVVDEQSGCWVWQGARDDNGYGSININGKLIRLHVLSARIWHGLSGRAKSTVRHTCDNPPCFNPAHLKVGTQADNMLDCAEKGRIANSKKQTCKNGHPLEGENLYLFTGRKGRTMRTCRECRKLRIKLYMRKKRGSSLPHRPITL